MGIRAVWTCAQLFGGEIPCLAFVLKSSKKPKTPKPNKPKWWGEGKMNQNRRLLVIVEAG